MNILYLCSDSGIPVLGRKGASVHVRSLAAAFTRAGHSVVVAAPLLTKSPWEAPAVLDAQIFHVPASDAIVAAVQSLHAYNDTLGTSNTVPGELRRILYNQQLQAKLVGRFEQAPPDFIYERAAVYGTVGVAVARALHVPLIVELNAPLSLEQSTYRGSHLQALASVAERRTLAGADLVLTVSSPLREYVIAQGVPPERVVMMPNGVDAALFVPGPPSPETRARWGIADGPVVGFVGSLRPWHGVGTLPDLLDRLGHRHPTLQLVIVGDGPLRRELADAFQARSLADHVVFTGALAHEQIADLVRLFDVALAPYDEPEHLFYFSPLKLFEYMACGVPVVAAAIGQISDVIRHDENGFLYPPGDLESLTAACEHLLEDPALGRRLGQAAAATVHSHYTWHDNARRVVQLVQRVLMSTEEVYA